MRERSTQDRAVPERHQNSGESGVTDIAFSSARQLARLIRAKEIGCLELLEHYLARVARHNPKLNAIIATRLPDEYSSVDWPNTIKKPSSSNDRNRA